MEGINAALLERGEAGWCPRRDEAYLGVLVDDLITRGVSEPYRMFTSRAEYLLQLREDNADMRLTAIGRKLGLVDDTRWRAFNEKREAIERETARLQGIWVRPEKISESEQMVVLGSRLEREYSLFSLLRRPHVNYRALIPWAGGVGAQDPLVAEQVEIAAKYGVYIERQQQEVERQLSQEGLALPPDLDFASIRGLSKEVQQKLNQFRPQTLGQASRVQGVTPAAISLLLVYLKRHSLARAA